MTGAQQRPRQRLRQALQREPERLQGQRRSSRAAIPKRWPRRSPRIRAGNAPAHPAGVRGRHGDDDGGEGRDQAGVRGDGRRRREVRPEELRSRGRRLLHEHRRARCCRSRSTARRTVFYYNKDAFEKAGLDPEQAADDVARGRRRGGEAEGRRATKCRFTTGWQSWMQLESFSRLAQRAVRHQGERLRAASIAQARRSTARCRCGTSTNMQDWIEEGLLRLRAAARTSPRRSSSAASAR